MTEETCVIIVCVFLRPVTIPKGKSYTYFYMYGPDGKFECGTFGYLKYVIREDYPGYPVIQAYGWPQKRREFNALAATEHDRVCGLPYQ